ncbi:hydroxymethylbilane synthase [Crocinitomix algicola]|uniref:hydroxymethylbilane synthase n=1 Tax=Crocinitomix algicola TaxID=1740263 RepID=UPI0008335C7E|nr:hydroxymethylbilane synthase [Crocinitomix algicola]
MNIRIGSRGSDLALWQAHFVEKELKKLGHQVSIKIIETKGDRIQDLSFDKIEGKGFFTKEIENALLDNSIDLAVHSHKDLETEQPKGLKIAAVSYRENPTDQLLIRKSSADKSELLEIIKNGIVGTSSARRKSQLLRLRPDVVIKDLRGNVPTRINKLREGQYDAIVLATAGIKRLDLDLSDLVCVELAPTQFVPAPAQGVLGLQIRANDNALESALEPMHHKDVAAAIAIERGVLKLLNGGCQLPLGVFAVKESDKWQVEVSHSHAATSPSNLKTYSFKEEEGIAEHIVADIQGRG